MEEPTPVPPASGGDRSESGPQWLWRQIKSLVPALLVVFAIRSTIAEPFKIPSGSMIPTLLVGDYVFVNKFAYGVKVPFTEWFGDPTYIVKRDPPKRGDVIVFLFPRDESINFIKRIVGVPGDRIEVRDKVLFLNGEPQGQVPVDQARIETTFQAIKDPMYTPGRYEMKREKLARSADVKAAAQGGDNVKEHDILIEPGVEGTTNFGPVTVPADHYFCMGDNRDGSNDSRFWGFVPFQNIKGRAVVIWMSLWFSPPAFRPERFGTLL